MVSGNQRCSCRRLCTSISDWCYNFSSVFDAPEWIIIVAVPPHILPSLPWVIPYSHRLYDYSAQQCRIRRDLHPKRSSNRRRHGIPHIRTYQQYILLIWRPWVTTRNKATPICLQSPSRPMSALVSYHGVRYIETQLDRGPRTLVTKKVDWKDVGRCVACE